jgi:hypothetical protein
MQSKSGRGDLGRTADQIFRPLPFAAKSSRFSLHTRGPLLADAVIRSAETAEKGVFYFPGARKLSCARRDHLQGFKARKGAKMSHFFKSVPTRVTFSLLADYI